MIFAMPILRHGDNGASAQWLPSAQTGHWRQKDKVQYCAFTAIVRPS
jgi:hypothetical protein